MLAILIPVTCIIFGLIIGSFLTVCIYRMPLGRSTDPYASDEEEAQEENLSKAPQAVLDQTCGKPITIYAPSRSFCTTCGQRLLWWHNIPVLSWIILRGKCAFCSSRISFRYPLIEGLTGLLAFLCWYVYGMTPAALIVFAFSCALLVLSVIDLDYFIIPNKITLPGVAIGFAVAGINHFWHIFGVPVVPNLLQALLGVLSGGGFLFLVSELYYLVRKKEGLGMGDVKLLAMTGAFFGWNGALYTIFIGSLLGAVLGGLHVLICRGKWSQPLPFGPYLAFATLLYLFAGEQPVAYAVKNLFKF